ncbi:MAG: hypothetical protein M1834_007779 [Cirrosporium novae-zelandiae]|nr:MAG: hypothetical protein M1834_007779 [Cirrosporium novae-zelandiae]
MAYNPFMKRERHGPRSILAYKVCTILSWLLLVIISIYYTVAPPDDGKHTHEGKHGYRTIWGQNSAHHTPFAMNSVVTSLYWLVLFILQLGYVWHLYSSNEAWIISAANVGSHFIFNNLLLFGFVMLWVRAYFWVAELLLIINLSNLLALYYRYLNMPLLIHIPVTSGPLAWTFIAIFWDGAAATNAHSLAARIVANIFIWTILLFGFSFLMLHKDYTMGFCLSILTLALALSQFLTKVIALQWIFAFVIFGILFLLSLAVAIPGLFGDFKFGRDQHVVSEDRERQPLLQDE